MARERRLAFGEVAELYDRARPSYPAALVEDVLELAAPSNPTRALEVGAGTGKATVLFAQRGVAVHALEPSAEMAHVAERNCARYPGVTVERSDFEHWQPHGATFPLLYSAQAWHWVAPESRYANARSVLEPGGVLAAFWNRPDWERCPLREEIDEAYATVAPELLPDGPMRPGSTRPQGNWGRWTEEIDGVEGFERPEVRTYAWDTRYSSREYSQLLRTHSDHIVLDGDTQRRLCAAVQDVIDRHGGVLALTYLTHLCLAGAAP
jgi:SAM-dependent methyltransferase